MLHFFGIVSISGEFYAIFILLSLLPCYSLVFTVQDFYYGRISALRNIVGNNCCNKPSALYCWLVYNFQVPIPATDHISEQPFRLSFPSYHPKMVHWFKSWSVPRNDIHVPEPHRRSGWKSAFCRAEKCSGISLLLILMFLFNSWIYFPDTHIFPSYVQIVLLLLALVAVPWMLLPKPFLLKKQHEQVCFEFSYFLCVGATVFVCFFMCVLLGRLTFD